MKVQFVKKFDDCILPEFPNDTFVIYREGYPSPNIPNVRDSIEFEKFKGIYDGIHIGMLIFFGLNRIVNPSNRCDFIFEFLQVLTPHIPKISIDISPFIGEPWQLWWHYSIAQCGDFKVPYSYTIETEWSHWFYRETEECRFANGEIKGCISDTYSNLDLLSYQSEFYQPSKQDLEWYKEMKNFVLNKYNSPKLWINDLLKKCNAKFNLNFGYESYRTPRTVKKGFFDLQKERNILPDLGIYRFVDEENKRRLSIYNDVIEVGRKSL